MLRWSKEYFLSLLVSLLIKGHVHQGTFRQFIAYNGCKQQIACKFQATRKQLVAYNTCTLTLKMVVKSFCLLLALFYWLRH